MPLNNQQREGLLKMLEAKGWFWRDDFIFAPNETMSLHGATPWDKNLPDFYERMVGRKQRIIKNKAYHRDETDHKKVVDDVSSLVDVLEELIKTSMI